MQRNQPKINFMIPKNSTMRSEQMPAPRAYLPGFAYTYDPRLHWLASGDNQLDQDDEVAKNICDQIKRTSMQFILLIILFWIQSPPQKLLDILRRRDNIPLIHELQRRFPCW